MSAERLPWSLAELCWHAQREFDERNIHDPHCGLGLRLTARTLRYWTGMGLVKLQAAFAGRDVAMAGGPERERTSRSGEFGYTPALDRAASRTFPGQRSCLERTSLGVKEKEPGAGKRRALFGVRAGVRPPGRGVRILREAGSGRALCAARARCGRARRLLAFSSSAWEPALRRPQFLAWRRL